MISFNDILNLEPWALSFLLACLGAGYRMPDALQIRRLSIHPRLAMIIAGKK
jgi:hypothetical protein